MFNIILALMWIILDRHHLFLTKADTTNVLLPINEFLDDDRAQAKLVIAMD